MADRLREDCGTGLSTPDLLIAGRNGRMPYRPLTPEQPQLAEPYD